MTIYDRIKARRIELGLSQVELAEKVGYKGRSAISKIENGERDISSTLVMSFAHALDVSVAYLLLGHEIEEPAEPEESDEEKRLKDFISLFSQLTPEQQKMLILQMKGLLSNDE